jgi:hypothetical protein
MSQKPGYGYTTERVCDGSFSFQMAPGDIDNWKDSGNRRVEVQFENYELAHGFMTWLRDHGVSEITEKPPYAKVLPTFTFAPADVLAAVKFQNSVYHISFGNGQVAEQFERFCQEAGINFDDSSGNVENTVSKLKEELQGIRQTNESLKEHAVRLKEERDRAREEKERMEDGVGRLEDRIEALQEALTDAAERELRLKRRLDTQSRG